MFPWLFAILMAPADEGGGGGGGSGASGDGAGGSGTGDGAGQGGSQGGTLMGSGGKGAPAGGQGDGAAGAGGAGDGAGGKPAGQGDPPGGTGQGAPGPWLLADGVEGTGEPPAWFKRDKYKTIAAQAEALPGLEQRLGKAGEVLGAPETADNYTLPEVKDWQWNAEDPLLKTWRNAAHKLGLSDKAFQQVAAEVGEVLRQEQETEQTELSDAIAALGANAAQRINGVEQYIRSTWGDILEGGKRAGDAMFEVLDRALGNNVEAFLALEQIVAKAAGDAQLAGAGGRSGAGYTRADIEAERYKTFPEGHRLAGKTIYDHDKAHREKVDGMWKTLFPGEDRQEVG